MTWNYRVHHKMTDLGEDFDIIEAYYNDAGELVNWAEHVWPYGDTLDDLRADLGYMVAAVERPALEDADLPR